ncbi:MAG: hypothetical protein UU35_C0025G0006 [Candidatus Uhrbacteria bacterium GW2011_GWC2_41_11]|uniref:DUF3179 domain-containing protein n=1 Tax=Candidatus Uhrbacteria bacterium GW2011_GWC2_41_11 TaxID=1618985 RepID=A0A0G0UA83_9BACT|nr:MAG: hypothetical protein UU35_C0025G0006 [Candidatus Uhrbacteria bacterium GW2011_GWC2_41_11]HBP00529.1 hypothetical protein [Candidatus Uhrbacteria bacterium]
MKHRFHWILFFVILILLGGFIFWREYGLRRTPIVSEPIAPLFSEVHTTDNVKHLIPLQEIVSAGVAKDGIPPIADPQFESVAAADQYLKEDGVGLLVEKDGHVRFYPYQILVWHEVVNDVFGGMPLVVTFSPLTFSGLVFQRDFGGDVGVLDFGTSGEIYNNNLLMYDRKTDTLWSQAYTRAVRGDLTGTTFQPYPSTVISWKQFRNHFPKGEVLSRETGAVRDYTRDPYGTSYYDSKQVWFPLTSIDDRLSPKTRIFGFEHDGSARAFPLDRLIRDRVISDDVSTYSLLVLYDKEQETVQGFSRDLDGHTLTFEWNGTVLKDKETGTTWNFDGKGIKGELAGTTLKTVSLFPFYWFAWAAFYPSTDVVGLNGK